MEEIKKEVFFHLYCPTCKHKNVKDTEGQDPCDECLGEPVNLYSHKPVRYEESEVGYESE